jgi:hypothetical protein
MDLVERADRDNEAVAEPAHPDGAETDLDEQVDDASGLHPHLPSGPPESLRAGRLTLRSVLDAG